MGKRKVRNYLILLVFIFSTALGAFVYMASKPSEEGLAQKKIQKNLEQRLEVAKSLEPFLKTNKFPETVSATIGSKQDAYKVKYTLDRKLQNEAEKLLQSYKPDYGAIFMMDSLTGQVLAMASFEKNPTAEGAQSLALRATYPAASVFKIVTATTAIDKAGLTPGHTVQFNGGNYTLYRKNVLSDKTNKWTRSMTLKEAFARSINTVFGRLTLKNIEPTDLNEYAHRFMFNQIIPSDFPVDMSLATVPNEKTFELAEIASGYNKMNRMSPVQGAMIAGSIVNDGKMVIPFLIDELSDSTGQVIYRGEPLEKGYVMSEASAAKVKELMEQTILAGTSRSSFRPLVKNKKFREIEMGGKTGHLTGDNPKGRVDWFVGYAFDDSRRVSLAAITVNVKYWTVKSSYLGQSMFRKYFEPILQSKMARTEGP